MSKRRPAKKFILWLIVMLTMIVTPVQGIQAQGGLDWLFGNEGRASQELSDKDLQMLNDLYRNLKGLYIEDIPKEQLLEGAMKGMVSALGDPYSEFLNAEESQVYEETAEGSFSGVGIQFMANNGVMTVISAVDGTPASKAGIRPNDVILKADDQELTDMDTQEVINLIRGPVGSEVTLTIQRADQTFDVTLTREEIPITTVDGEIDRQDKEIGKIKISQFNGTTYDELVETVEQLRQKGAKRFVFDLRYNPGGLLDQALEISNMFLKDGDVIMQMQEGQAKAISYQASDKDYGDFQISEPFVLLVNEGSASASEILTGAIKENTKAPIVGVTTFGKGSVQTFTNSNSLGELKITFAKWLLPSGTWIHETGIEPTDQVEAAPVETAILINPESTLKLGEVSPEVESLGLSLEALGYLKEPKKYFDEKMEAAVKAFQKDHDLKETGQVEGETTQILTEQIRDYLETHDKQYEKAVEILNEYAGQEKEQEAA